MALNFSTASEGEQGQTHGTLAALLRDVQGALPAPSEHWPREVRAAVLDAWVDSGKGASLAISHTPRATSHPRNLALH